MTQIFLKTRGTTMDKDTDNHPLKATVVRDKMEKLVHITIKAHHSTINLKIR